MLRAAAGSASLIGDERSGPAEIGSDGGLASPKPDRLQPHDSVAQIAQIGQPGNRFKRPLVPLGCESFGYIEPFLDLIEPRVNPRRESSDL